MSFATLQNALRRGSRTTGRPRPAGPQKATRRRAFKPRLDVLEDRTLPSTVPIVVTSLADSGAGTLRDAIATANSDTSHDYIIDFAGTGAINLTSALPDLNNNIAIQGPGAGSLTVRRDTATLFGIFTVDTGRVVSISDMAIANGDSSADGGGILNDGTLTVANCTLTNNAAVFGGGIENNGTLMVTNCTLTNNSAYLGGGSGGGINNEGTATITNCTLTYNSAQQGGGISNIDGTATITHCTLTYNSARDVGGGIDNFLIGTMTVTNCTLTNNSANRGGGLDNTSATLTLTDSTFNDNSATTFGGGIYSIGVLMVTNCTLTNNVAETGGGIVNANGTATVANCTLAHNTASAYGGGIYSGGFVQLFYPQATLTVTNCALADNSAGAYGGGIVNDGGNALVTNCTLANNSGGGVSGGGGGGIFNGPIFGNLTSTLSVASCNFTNNAARFFGGGIDNDGGIATITNCTLANNSDSFVGGGIYNGGSSTATISGCTLTNNAAQFGGGIYNNDTATLTDCTLSGNSAISGGGLNNAVNATLINCTVSGNTANGLDTAGGIDTSSANLDAFTTLINCTVANNTNLNAAGPGGLFAGRYGTATATVYLQNTIVGNNSGQQFGTAGATIGPGTFVSLGYNLSSDTSGNLSQPGDQQNANPLLAPLGNYGGPNQTMALLPGSPAIDAGSNALAVDAGNNPLTNDERGVARVVNGTVDIGAFESRPFTIALASGNGQSTAVHTSFPNPLVVTVTSAYGDPVRGGVVTFAAPVSGAGATFPAGGGGTATAIIDPVGQAAVGVTANTVAGGYVVQASARGASFAAGFSLTNAPDVARTFVVSGFPSPTVAGAAHTIVVTAKDQYGNTATGYAGVVHFTSTDPRAALPLDSLLTNGIGIFSVSLKTAGTQSLTATDAAFASLTGTQSGITVNPSLAAAFIIAAPGTVAPGMPFKFTVTAVDAYGNVATGYNGTIRFSSSDKNASLPRNATLTNGTGTFTATFKTKGTQTLTVTDVAWSGLTDSLTILVAQLKK